MARRGRAPVTAVAGAPRDVGQRLIAPEQDFFLLLEASEPIPDPVAWVAGNRGLLEDRLLSHGALLLRGFGIGPGQFRDIVFRVSPPGSAMDYAGGGSPRGRVAEDVYLSTRVPPASTMVQHHELSYFRRWPRKVFFYCETPATTGGETPICSSRRFLECLDPAIVERVGLRGILYVRNYVRGLGPSWQEAFETRDRSAVEAACRRNGVEVEWRSGDRLRTRHRAHGLARHPVTGETVFFNQAYGSNWRSGEPGLPAPQLRCLAPGMPPAILARILALPKDEVPYLASYGDGAEIEASVLEKIHGVFEAESVAIPWQAGDLLVLDNMLASHGRRPYTGARRILVALTEPHTADG